MTRPAADTDAMSTFCREHLPALLRDFGVDAALAEAIGNDVLARAEAYAALDTVARGALAAPFAEEVFEYQPKEASLTLKAAVNVVVRNSRLEEAHAHDGAVRADGVQGITALAAAPLSHLIAIWRQAPVSLPTNEPLFSELPTAYPRAWACCLALAAAFDTGGRHEYRSPDAPVPELPPRNEWAEPKMIDAPGNDKATVFSAIDPRFDRHLATQLSRAVDLQVPLYAPTLSRLSRNQDKLLHIMEYLLAHGATIVTTNYMLRPKDVWVRRRPWVRSDSWEPSRGLHELRGLSGAHRAVVIRLRDELV